MMKSTLFLAVLLGVAFVAQAGSVEAKKNGLQLSHHELTTPLKGVTCIAKGVAEIVVAFVPTLAACVEVGMSAASQMGLLVKIAVIPLCFGESVVLALESAANLVTECL